MIPKSKIAYVRSLHDKQTRYSEGVFLVEWRKSILECITSEFEIIEGFFTEKMPADVVVSFPVEHITQTELARLTTLISNDSWLLLVKMRPQVLPKCAGNELVLVLDGINDPGNLGTIVRIADWYRVTHIIASLDTVDFYNPKVLMATMGSFTRVSIFYTKIDQYLSKIWGVVYGAYLDGENIHTKSFAHAGAHLVIGSEAHGISTGVEPYITDRITIPRFGRAESLNAGVATAIIVDRIRSYKNTSSETHQ